MLTLQIEFEHRLDPKTALAGIRVRKNKSGMCLQGDLLHIPAGHDQNIRMGRSWSCDVFLLGGDHATSGVAKEHLRIEVISRRCFVRDLATKNGTLLNGQWLGGPPAPHNPPAMRIPSGRKALKSGDVIRLPGIILTVVAIPAGQPQSEHSINWPPLSSDHPVSPASGAGAANIPGALRLPPVVIFQPGESPGSPPELEDFKFAASLGGNPASGLTYLYERKNEKKTDGEKWVVKYVRLSDSTDLASLRQLLAAICDVPLAALPHPQAYCLVPTSQPTHLALCFPHLKGVDLARSPLLDLAAIHDVMTATLDSLAALHRHGLTHGHVCAGNIFLEAASQIALTDSGMNGIRSLIGAELTGPAPSAHHDLVAFGELCLKLLGETATAPQPSRVRPAREHPQDWPGAPLLALACRLRQDAELTASQALHLVQGVPRPKVNRLLTAPRWRSPRE